MQFVGQGAASLSHLAPVATARIDRPSTACLWTAPTLSSAIAGNVRTDMR
jgi:hypothetical protein